MLGLTHLRRICRTYSLIGNWLPNVFLMGNIIRKQVHVPGKTQTWYIIWGTLRSTHVGVQALARSPHTELAPKVLSFGCPVTKGGWQERNVWSPWGGLWFRKHQRGCLAHWLALQTPNVVMTSLLLLEMVFIGKQLAYSSSLRSPVTGHPSKNNDDDNIAKTMKIILLENNFNQYRRAGLVGFTSRMQVENNIKPYRQKEFGSIIVSMICANWKHLLLSNVLTRWFWSIFDFDFKSICNIAIWDSNPRIFEHCESLLSDSWSLISDGDKRVGYLLRRRECRWLTGCGSRWWWSCKWSYASFQGIQYHCCHQGEGKGNKSEEGPGEDAFHFFYLLAQYSRYFSKLSKCEWEWRKNRSDLYYVNYPIQYYIPVIPDPGPVKRTSLFMGDVWFIIHHQT